MTENTDKPKLNPEIERIKAALSLEYLNFVDAYLRGMTPCEALAHAGFATGEAAADKAAAERILNAPKIKLYIDALERSTAQRSLMTLDAVDARLTDIAMTDVVDLLEVGTPYENENGDWHTPVNLKNVDELTAAQKAAITSIRANGAGGVEIKCADKLKALELLAKRRGGFKELVDVSLAGNVHIFANVGDNGRAPDTTD